MEPKDNINFNKYFIKFFKREWFNSTKYRTRTELMVFTAKHFLELGKKIAINSAWHDANEEPNLGEVIVLYYDDSIDKSTICTYGAPLINIKSYDKWAYLSDILPDVEPNKE